jgi:hypothetical protein
MMKKASSRSSTTSPAPRSSKSSPFLAISLHLFAAYSAHLDTSYSAAVEYSHTPLTYSQVLSSYSVMRIFCIVGWVLLNWGTFVAVARGIREGWRRGVMEGSVKKRAFADMD